MVEWALDQSPLEPDVEPLLLSLVELGNEVQVMIDYRYTDGAQLAVTISLEKSTDPSGGTWNALPPPSPDLPVNGIVSVSVVDAERFDFVNGTGPLKMYYRLRISGTDNGQAFAYTSPMVGYHRLRCLAGSDTHSGLMFRQRSVHRADCPGAPLPAATAGQWTVSYAAQPASLAPGQTVRFESGVLAGQAFLVTAVNAGGFDVAGDLSSVASGDRYRVAPSWTTATLLSMAGTVIEDSTNYLGLNRGNEILHFDQRGNGFNRSATAVLYHLPTTGWRSTVSVTALEDGHLLDSDGAFVVRGAGPQVTADAWLVMAGAEVETSIVTTIGAGGSDTVIALQRAVPVKLRDAALFSSGAFEGSADTQPVNRRDELMICDNAVIGLNKQPSAIFYYDLSSGLWRSTTAPASDAGDVELAPGAFLKIRSASGGSTTWTLPATP